MSHLDEKRDTVYAEPGDDLHEVVDLAAGRELRIRPGQYHVDVSSGSIEPEDNTTIKGIGRPTLLPTDGPRGLFYIEDTHHVSIEGLELDGQGESRRAIEVLSKSERGNHDVSVRDCHIHDFHPKTPAKRIWGIRIGDVNAAYRNTDVRFVDNVVEGFAEDRKDNVLFGFMDGFEIRGNTFRDIARNVFLYYSKHGLVQNNTYDMPAASYSMPIIAEDTTIRDESYLEGTAPMRVINNNEHEADLSGVTVEACSFRKSGIHVNDGGAGQPIEDVTVENCTIHGNAAPHLNNGIQVGPSNGGAIEHVHLRGNRVSGAYWNGVLFADVVGGSIRANEVFNNNQGGGPVPDGIQVVDSRNVSVTDNDVYDDREEPTQTDGIGLTSTRRAFVQGNRTHGNGRRGFLERGDCADNRVVDNDFQEGTEFGDTAAHD